MSEKYVKHGVITYVSGAKEYWNNGKLHRIDGPAVERPSGFNQWLVNDKLHRLDGPAMKLSNGDELWFFNDIEYDKKYHPFNIFINEYNLSEKYDDWSIDMKVLFKLIYGDVI